MAKSTGPFSRISSELQRASDLPSSFAGRTHQDAICHVQDKARELRETLLTFHGLEGLLGQQWHERKDEDNLRVPAGELRQMLTAFNNDTMRVLAALDAAIELVHSTAD